MQYPLNKKSIKTIYNISDRYARDLAHEYEISMTPEEYSRKVIKDGRITIYRDREHFEDWWARRGK